MNTQNIDKYITEVLHVTDPAEKRLIQQRILDAVRTAQAAEAAAKTARANGNEELAQKLEARAQELKELAAHAYEDIIDDDEESQDSSDTNSEKDVDKSEDSSTAADDTDDKATDSEDTDSKESDETSDKDTDSSKDDSDKKDNPFDDIDSKQGGQQNSSEANSDKDSGSDSDKNNSSSKDKNNSDTDDSDSDKDSDSDTEGDSDTDIDSDKDEDGDSDNKDDNSDSDGAKSDSDSDEDSDKDLDSDSDADEDSDSDSDKDSDSSDSSSSSASNGSEEDEDTDSDEDEEDDDAPVKDPFADDEDIPSMPSMGQQGQEPRDATLEDIIKELKGLSGESKRELIQALKDIQSDRSSGEKKESLQEALLAEAKNIRELDDDEYAELINDTLDMIDQASKELTYSDNTERKAKVKEINNPSVRRELTKEISDDAVKAHQEVKAREQELNKYKNCKTIEEFEINFYNTINTEVNWIKQKKKSWNEINNDYEGEDILVKADVTKKHLEEIIPVIDFYFDCSGSWTEYPDAIKIGQRAVATVKEFADEGLVKLNVLYFGRNSLSSEMSAVWDGGTHCWEQIIANIKKTGATNVVLMTDGDMEDQARNGHGVRVDGCVWFIWGLGGYHRGPGYSEQGHEIPKKLIGNGNNTHYAFDVKGNKY